MKSSRITKPLEAARVSLQDASSIADLNRGGDPAVESGARVDRAAIRVDAGGNIVKQRPSPRAEGSEGLKTNGATFSFPYLYNFMITTVITIGVAYTTIIWIFNFISSTIVSLLLTSKW